MRDLPQREALLSDAVALRLGVVSESIRDAAMKIVLAEERAAGWSVHVVGSAAREKEHGCDILSTPPGGGEPHPVEVKGWGEPFLSSRSGRFIYRQDMRQSQMEAARGDPISGSRSWRT